MNNQEKKELGWLSVAEWQTIREEETKDLWLSWREVLSATIDKKKKWLK